MRVSDLEFTRSSLKRLNSQITNHKLNSKKMSESQKPSQPFKRVKTMATSTTVAETPAPPQIQINKESPDPFSDAYGAAVNFTIGPSSIFQVYTMLTEFQSSTVNQADRIKPGDKLKMWVAGGERSFYGEGVLKAFQAEVFHMLDKPKSFPPKAESECWGIDMVPVQGFVVMVEVPELDRGFGYRMIQMSKHRLFSLGDCTCYYFEQENADDATLKNEIAQDTAIGAVKQEKNSTTFPMPYTDEDLDVSSVVIDANE
jgi:hypothetical protein